MLLRMVIAARYQARRGKASDAEDSKIVPSLATNLVPIGVCFFIGAGAIHDDRGLVEQEEPQLMPERLRINCQ